MEAQMKILFAAATALAMSGSALAYQSYPTHTTHTTTATEPAPVVAVVDPSTVIVVPAGWTAEQRALWEEQMDFHPGWTPAEVAAFEAMMAIPPANWTAEQRALYAAHLSHIPPSWTAAQQATFASMVDPMRTPWMSVAQTAAVEDTTTTTSTTYAAAPASGSVVQPSNANPEHDARGIAVISDPAFVPAGYNGVPATGVGGPVEGDDASYPACTATVTDNCIQLYERGVRESLASYTRQQTTTTTTSVGGPYVPVGEDEAGDNTAEDDALDVDVEPDGDIDVDGDLDNDGDNDLE
jgi:hypothetical protein